MPLIASDFTVATPEQVLEQDKRVLEAIQQSRNWQKAREMSDAANKALRDRELANCPNLDRGTQRDGACSHTKVLIYTTFNK
jgi:hypothetical protein